MAAFNRQSNDDKEELCPNCKKSFKRLSQHTRHCRGEMCPSCGLFFKRLASHVHHCKGRDDTISKTTGGEVCPGCGLFFKRLASHVQHCKGGDQTRLKTTEGEVCPGCGVVFKRLAAHVQHCKGTDQARPKTSEGEVCPSCGIFFKRLASHVQHCKGGDQTWPKTTEGEVCPDCGLFFKRLASHVQHCKGGDQTRPKTTEGEVCPDCGLFFKRLASHVQHCKGRDHTRQNTTEGEVCPDCGIFFKRLASHVQHCKGGDQARPKPTEGEVCPGCGIFFKRLASHVQHCKGGDQTWPKTNEGEVCPGCGLFFKRLASHVQHCKGRHDTRSRTTEGEVCPGCGIFFKRLASHVQHCKGRDNAVISRATSQSDCDVCPDCNNVFKRLSSHWNHCVGPIVMLDRCENCKEDVKKGVRHVCKLQLTILPKVTRDPIYASDPKAKMRELTESVTLRKEDISRAADMINELRTNMPVALTKLDDYFVWTEMPSGSYYEKLKVEQPNEFDIMLTTTVKCRVHQEDSHPTYCSLEVIEPDRYASFLTDNKWLSPKAMKDHILKLIPRALEDFRKGRHIELVTSDASPAITLQCQTMDYKENRKHTYDIDLVLAIEIEKWPKQAKFNPKWKSSDFAKETKCKGLHVVAKAAVHESRCGRNQDRLWRWSFSVAEKELILHADSGQKTCRKSVHKALKGILEKTKRECNISDISSYHIKTFMLHQFDLWPKDAHWDNGKIGGESQERHQLITSMTKLQEKLKERRLAHYFITSENLLKDVALKDCECLCRVLDKEMPR